MKEDGEVKKVKAKAAKYGIHWTDERARAFLKMVEETIKQVRK
jgi:hypothetical protein